MARAKSVGTAERKAPARKPAASKSEEGGPLLLRSLRARNLLSFGPEANADEPLLEFRSLNVLIGPNGAGKSNLLDVISLLRRSVGNLRNELVKGGGIYEWRWKGKGSAEELPSLMAEVAPAGVSRTLRHFLHFGDAKAEFGLEQEAIVRVGPAGKTRHLYQQGPGFANLVDRRGRRQRLARESMKQDHSILSQRRDIDAYPEIYYLGEAYSKIRLYREWAIGRNTELRRPQISDMPADALEENFSNLGLRLSRLFRKPSVKAEIISRLRDLYEGITDFQVSPEAGGTLQVLFTEGDFTIPVTRLSDGSLRFLCLLAILCDPEPPPLIGIEEPELGLHPDLIGKVAELLVEASRRTQLIVTTHSDILVDALTDCPESIVICEKHEGQTSMRRLDRLELAEWLQHYRLGELWTRGHLGGNRW